MYTINGAYVMRQEETTGSLTEGKAADFIVINQDIFNLANPADILSTKVQGVILAGSEIWNKKYR